jgi:hypothetical protein
MNTTLFDLLANKTFTYCDVVRIMKALGKEFIDDSPVSYAAIAAALGENIHSLIRLLNGRQIEWLRIYILHCAIRVRYLIAEPCVMQLLDDLNQYRRKKTYDVALKPFDEYLERLRQRRVAAAEELVEPGLRRRIGLETFVADTVRHAADAILGETDNDLILIAESASDSAWRAVQLADGEVGAASERKRQVEDFKKFLSSMVVV